MKSIFVDIIQGVFWKIKEKLSKDSKLINRGKLLFRIFKFEINFGDFLCCIMQQKVKNYLKFVHVKNPMRPTESVLDIPKSFDF